MRPFRRPTRLVIACIAAVLVAAPFFLQSFLSLPHAEHPSFRRRAGPWLRSGDGVEEMAAALPLIFVYPLPDRFHRGLYAEQVAPFPDRVKEIATLSVESALHTYLEGGLHVAGDGGQGVGAGQRVGEPRPPTRRRRGQGVDDAPPSSSPSHYSRTTTDPLLADLFFIPVYAAARLSKRTHVEADRHASTALAIEAIDYVAKQWPYLRRHGGRDHVMVFSHDNSLCMDVNPHRGMHSPNVRTLLEKTRDMIIVSSNGDDTTGCFNPRKDIVVPPVIKKALWLRPGPLLSAKERTRFAYFRGMTTGEHPEDPWFSINLYSESTTPGSSGIQIPWPDICSVNPGTTLNNCAATCDAELLNDYPYSRGVRQRLVALFATTATAAATATATEGGADAGAGAATSRQPTALKNHKISISSKRSSTYIEDMRTSLFCLAPAG